MYYYVCKLKQRQRELNTDDRPYFTQEALLLCCSAAKGVKSPQLSSDLSVAKPTSTDEGLR